MIAMETTIGLTKEDKAVLAALGRLPEDMHPPRDLQRQCILALYRKTGKPVDAMLEICRGYNCGDWIREIKG